MIQKEEERFENIEAGSRERAQYRPKALVASLLWSSSHQRTSADISLGQEELIGLLRPIYTLRQKRMRTLSSVSVGRFIRQLIVASELSNPECSG